MHYDTTFQLNGVFTTVSIEPGRTLLSGWPSTMTMHAPHSASVQPSLVPTRPRSSR